MQIPKVIGPLPPFFLSTTLGLIVTVSLAVAQNQNQLWMNSEPLLRTAPNWF